MKLMTKNSVFAGSDRSKMAKIVLVHNILRDSRVVIDYKYTAKGDSKPSDQ